MKPPKIVTPDIVRDSFKVLWNLPYNEVCPTCGQPDNIGDCIHFQLDAQDVRDLGGVVT